MRHPRDREGGSPAGTQKAVVAAVAGNLLVTATKAVAAVVTGSAAMLSEALHSFVDSANEPQEIENPLVSEVVLGLSFLFEGWSWLVSHPEVTSLYIKPQSPEQFTKSARRRFGDEAEGRLAAPARSGSGLQT
jgi:hypothetical protein